MNFKYLIIFIFLISSSYLKINASGAESSIFGYVPSTGPGTLIEWFNAARNNRVDRMHTLIKTCDVNAQDYGTSDFTALIWAAHEGKVSVVDFLLNAPNIDINKQDRSGNTALMRAISKGHENIAQRLLETQGINVNTQSNDGFSALLLAVCYERENIVNLLLKVPDINVNVCTTKNRETALMHVAGVGNENLVNLLLAFPGINVNFKNIDGEDALKYAENMNHENIIKLIKTKMAVTAKLFEAIEDNNLETV